MKQGRRLFSNTNVWRKRLIVLVVLLTFFGVSGALFAADLIPPEIDDVQIASVGEDDVVITWTTDEESDSLINFGLTTDVGIVRDPLPNKTEHSITISDLEKATRYYFRVVSSDRFGNQNVSGNFSFTTRGARKPIEDENIEDEEQREIVTSAVDLIDQITDPDAIKIIADKVEEVTGRIILPPSIIGDPDMKEIGMDYAVVSWVTDRESNSVVKFSSDYEYNPGAADPYLYTQGDLNELVKYHEVRLIGLSPETIYHVQISSTGEYDLMGKTNDITFTTKSQLAQILNVQLLKVEETAATVAWNTSVVAGGTVIYTNLLTGEVRQEGSPELLPGHTVRLANLTFGTTYSAVVVARNAAGEETYSEPIVFTTTRDRFPPDISRVNNESTLYPGSEAKIQTIVSWQTDEPAACQFFYRQGLADSADAIPLDAEKQPTEDHVQVVVDFLPSTVYKFWVACTDPTGNESRSDDFVLFTPEKEKSIIDIILENFEGAFGWVKNIGK